MPRQTDEEKAPPVQWLANALRGRCLHAVVAGSNSSLCHPYLRQTFKERDGLARCPKCVALLRHGEVGDGSAKPVTAYAIYAGRMLILRDERVPIYWVKSVAEGEASALRDLGHRRAEVRPVLLSPLPANKRAGISR